MRNRTKFFVAVLGAVLAFGGIARADVGTLVLSTNSSDATPASVLDARFEFDVSGSTLLLTVFNDTAGTQLYDINEIYFNSTAKVTDVAFAGLTGWVIKKVGTDLPPTRSADGFGFFDYALKGWPDGGEPGIIAPGTSRTFEFSVSFTGAGISASDFMTTFSTIPPGNSPMLAAAKFVRGPSDDSAYGGVVPAPGAALLGMFGFGMVGWVKRKFA